MKYSIKQTVSLLLPLTFVLGGVAPVSAMEGMDMGDMPGMHHMHADAHKHEAAQGVGVVEELDATKGVVTLTHEPIKSLGWPSMTMDFSVEDKALFNKLKRGKKVQFDFVKNKNRYVLQHVLPLSAK